MVRSTKVVRRHLTESNSTPAMDLGPIMFVGIVVCACSRFALGFKIIFLRSFVMKGLLFHVDCLVFGCWESF